MYLAVLYVLPMLLVLLVLEMSLSVAVVEVVNTFCGTAGIFLGSNFLFLTAAVVFRGISCPACHRRIRSTMIRRSASPLTLKPVPVLMFDTAPLLSSHLANAARLQEYKVAMVDWLLTTTSSFFNFTVAIFETNLWWCARSCYTDD